MYVEDILIYGRTKEEHKKTKGHEEIDSSQPKGKQKCIFEEKEILFLGYKIAKNKLVSMKENRASILEYQAPKDVEGIKSYLNSDIWKGFRILTLK